MKTLMCAIDYIRSLDRILRECESYTCSYETVSEENLSSVVSVEFKLFFPEEIFFFLVIILGICKSNFQKAIMIFIEQNYS